MAMLVAAAVPEALWFMVKLVAPILATVVPAGRLLPLARGAPTYNWARSDHDTAVTVLLPLLRLPVMNCPLTVIVVDPLAVALLLTLKVVAPMELTVVADGRLGLLTGAPTYSLARSAAAAVTTLESATVVPLMGNVEVLDVRLPLRS